jgi:hypothetical protein
MSLLPLHDVKFQFIPAHKEIGGNEAADRAAKEAHSLRYRTLTPASKEETVRSIHDAFLNRWNNHWLENVRATGKGLFLTQIKHKIENWPWALHGSRVIETSMARLGVGHAGVRSHLARFNLADSPNCQCGAVETIEHLLLMCPIYRQHRTTLINKLISMNVIISLKNMLGGGPFSVQTQREIVEAVGNYLISINKLNQI